MIKLRGAEENLIYFGATPEVLRIAGELKHSMTPSEKLLWEQLRRRNVKGYRFRRQHAVKDFIVDFFCYEAMLAIEVDREVHDERGQNERDIERTTILNQLGIKVLRFRNSQIENNIEEVLHIISMKLKETEQL
ncbi:MAG: endonuclease domain-containing protein [Bacteroidetes bacterium]|nr:endonuclease domain-containing protein [Bacteroidota bacterium]